MKKKDTLHKKGELFSIHFIIKLLHYSLDWNIRYHLAMYEIGLSGA